MLIQNVIDVVNKWLLLKDTRQVVRVLLGTVVANLLQGDPVWLFIIAPPSSAKTELIRALNDIHFIYPLSDLTPQTLISGMIGREKKGSLLLRLNNKILTFKDFTTVLSMHRDKRSAILAQLREIYDGHYKKDFGTGASIEWKGKLGFISGVTPIIDTQYSIYTVLGERFIQYRPEQPQLVEMAKIAMKSAGKENAMREEMRSIFSQFIESIKIPKKADIKISDEIEDKLANLATFCVLARSGVIREGYSRDIVYTPEPEAPARLAKQLATLSCGLSVINCSSEVSMKDYELVHRVGMDTLHRLRRDILCFLKDKEGPVKLSCIAYRLCYPLNTIRNYLHDLLSLGLVSKSSISKGSADEWRLSEYSIELLEKAQPYPKCHNDRV